jgi:FkbM family methyltransferase
MIRRFRLTILLASGMVAVGLFLGYFGGSGQRWELTRAKLGGEFQQVSWFRLIRYMWPRRIKLPRPLNHLLFVHAEKKQAGTCPVLWETPMGAFWGRYEDDGILRGAVVEQTFYFAYDHAPVAVHAGDVVLDAGAHLGTFTRFALNRGARRVVAFEPEPTNITCFKRTFEPELQSGRVVLVQSALWEQSGTVAFEIHPEEASESGSVLAPGSPNTVTVPATTIDETVARLGLDHVDFIKMDIEGAERYALRAGHQTISHFAPRMALSVEHLPDDQQAIPSAVFAAKPDYHLIRTDSVCYFY